MTPARAALRRPMAVVVAVVLENILAEQDQSRARQDYVRAIGEYDKAQYALSRAVGRLPTSGGEKTVESTAPQAPNR